MGELSGRPRLVRSSRASLLAHSAAIAAALDIHPRHVAATSLPLFYTYGLNVLKSHLAAGATVVVADGGMLAAPFWAAVREHGVTTLAGVPHHFRMLERLRWRPAQHPSVRWFTVAGGAMPDALALRVHEPLAEGGGDLYVMYGQTKAGSRITVLPPGRLAATLGSVGTPVPGTRLGGTTHTPLRRRAHHHGEPRRRSGRLHRTADRHPRPHGNNPGAGPGSGRRRLR